MSSPDDLATTFIDAIARCWGLSLNCQPCGVYTRWSDAKLATAVSSLQLDRPTAEIRGRVKCPECRKVGLRINPYQAGAMNWRRPAGQTFDMLATIENRKAELRETAREKAADTPPAGSYAGAKMRN